MVDAREGEAGVEVEGGEDAGGGLDGDDDAVCWGAGEGVDVEVWGLEGGVVEEG